MVKKLKLGETHADKTWEQIYPETHANAVYGLADFINDILTAQSNRLANGTDLNNLDGTHVYVSNGAQCQNVPYQCDRWFTLTTTEINSNTFTQQIIDSKGHLWTRGAGGNNKLWSQWRLCN
ncbi:hypothetical protein [Liquorilactobacillus uvarum]|uniref:hypothetical protein n=1 Tax=Liquorilactobacillus uvarum TaxID=303240 RepID=UPI0028890A61|nr:hypothetical protein [Liquorilactobacillus uvarum]